MLPKIASGDYSWHSFLDFAMTSVTMHLVLGHDKQVNISESGSVFHQSMREC